MRKDTIKGRKDQINALGRKDGLKERRSKHRDK